MTRKLLTGALTGLLLMSLLGCNAQPTPIVQTIRPLQIVYPDPIGIEFPKLVFMKAIIDGVEGYFIAKNDFAILYDYLTDSLRWAKQKVAQVKAFKQQVLDNNAHSGVAGDGNPLHAIRE